MTAISLMSIHSGRTHLNNKVHDTVCGRRLCKKFGIMHQINLITWCIIIQEKIFLKLRLKVGSTNTHLLSSALLICQTAKHSQKTEKKNIFNTECMSGCESTSNIFLAFEYPVSHVIPFFWLIPPSFPSLLRAYLCILTTVFSPFSLFLVLQTYWLISFFYYYDYFCQMAQLSLYCHLLTYSTDFRQTCARWKKIEEDKPPSLICWKWFPDSQPISLSPCHAQNNAMSILGYQSILKNFLKFLYQQSWKHTTPD